MYTCFSSSSKDSHSPSQVRHTGRNSLTPFPFAPFFLQNFSCLSHWPRQVCTCFFKFVDRFPLTFSSSSYWPQFFYSRSLCSFLFAELFPVCHTGRDRCTLVISSSSTDSHSPSQVRHTGRNSLTPFPFAPFVLHNFFLSVTLAATGVYLFYDPPVIHQELSSICPWRTAQDGCVSGHTGWGSSAEDRTPRRRKPHHPTAHWDLPRTR